MTKTFGHRENSSNKNNQADRQSINHNHNFKYTICAKRLALNGERGKPVKMLKLRFYLKPNIVIAKGIVLTCVKSYLQIKTELQQQKQ